MRDWNHLLDEVLAKPGMFVGTPAFAPVAAFVEGFGTALDDGTLERFRTWLAGRCHQPQSPLAWSELVLDDARVQTDAGTHVDDDTGSIAHLRSRLSELLASEKDHAR